MKIDQADFDAGLPEKLRHRWWFLCCHCGKLFTQERGWQWPNDLYGVEIFVCAKCAPTPEQAQLFFNQEIMRMHNNIKEFWAE